MWFWTEESRFRDPSRFDRLTVTDARAERCRGHARKTLRSIQSIAEDSVTMFGKLAPKVKRTQTKTRRKGGLWLTQGHDASIRWRSLREHHSQGPIVSP